MLQVFKIINMYKKYILLFCILIICKIALCQCKNCGVAVMSRKIYDTVTNNYVLPHFLPEYKVFYKDSTAIREVYKIRREDETKYEISIDKYIFIDLINRSFYEYAKFSVDSFFTKSYIPSDTSKDYSFAYIFFGYSDPQKNANPKLSLKIPDEKYNSLPDTIIDAVKFKRLRCEQIIKNGEINQLNIWTIYFRYDIKNSIMHYDKDFDQKMNWPVVRIEVKDPKFQTCFEIKYERQYLTNEELKVFDAWEKNAKLNPVK